MNNASVSIEWNKKPNGSIELTANLENQSPAEIVFKTMSSQVFDFTVQDTTGEAVNLAPPAYQQAVTRQVIQPGETLSRTIEWKSLDAWREFNLETNLDELWEDVPGEYDEVEVTVTVLTETRGLNGLSATKTLQLA